MSLTIFDKCGIIKIIISALEGGVAMNSCVSSLVSFIITPYHINYQGEINDVPRKEITKSTKSPPIIARRNGALKISSLPFI